MPDILSIFLLNTPLNVFLLSINILIAIKCVRHVYIRTNSHILESKFNGQTQKPSTLKLYQSAVKSYLSCTKEKNRLIKRITGSIGNDAKKCGQNERTMFVFIVLIRFFLPLFMFVLTFIANFPNVFMPTVIAVLFLALAHLIIDIMKKNNSQQFKKYSFKIFRYLHNQISSGTPITDAIKTVHKVVDKGSLKNNLILLAGRYALSGNIDKALDEFKQKYESQDVVSLCIAIKQGIKTGDNSTLLEKQEDLMFDQFINYIKVQTDLSRTKATIAIILIGIMVVVMIAIPMIMEAAEGMQKIFVS